MEIDRKIILSIIYSFLEENSYTESLEKLQDESGHNYNVVKMEEDYLLRDVRTGRWDAVLKKLVNVRLPNELLYDLYEQVIFELVEEKDGKIGLILLQQPPVMKLKQIFPDQVRKLEILCRQQAIDMNVLYDQEEKGDKQERRERLALMLKDALIFLDDEKEQYRLIKLLSLGLDAEESGALVTKQTAKDPNAIKVDVSVEESKESKNLKLHKPNEIMQIVKNAKNIDPNKEIEDIKCAPKDDYLAVGCIDGIIEVWNKQTLDIETSESFEFQKDKKFMGHHWQVLCVEFSQNGKVLASGDSEGTINVWNFFKGKWVRKLEKAHSNHGISCIRISEDTSKIYSSSFDNVIKVHGLKSSSLIKEYQGHSSAVTEFYIVENDNRILSASSDGTLRVWNLEAARWVKIINPLSLSKQDEIVTEMGIINCQMYPDDNDKERKNYCLICHDGTNIALLVDIKNTKLVTSFYNDKPKTFYHYATFDDDGRYVFWPCSDGYLYCFETNTGKLVSIIELPSRKEQSSIFTKLLKLKY